MLSIPDLQRIPGAHRVPFWYIFLLSLFLGMVAAVIFQPLRTGTLSIIEKLYFGKRLDHYRNPKNFSVGITTP